MASAAWASAANPVVMVLALMALSFAAQAAVVPAAAQPSCVSAQTQLADFASGKTDATAALNTALAACAGGSLTPPVGTFRVDGTVTIGSDRTDPARNRTQLAPATHLHLGMGVELRRVASASDSTTPVVNLAGYRCRLTGEGGSIVSENASPAGIVRLGPQNRSVRSSIQFSFISGVHISGRYQFLPLGPGSASTPPPMNFSDIDTNAPWTNLSGYDQCGGWEGQVASFGSGGE